MGRGGLVVQPFEQRGLFRRRAAHEHRAVGLVGPAVKFRKPGQEAFAISRRVPAGEHGVDEAVHARLGRSRSARLGDDPFGGGRHGPVLVRVKDPKVFSEVEDMAEFLQLADPRKGDMLEPV